MARTLQVKSIFGGMSVAENVWIAAQSRRTVFHPFRSALSFGETRENVSRILAEIAFAGPAGPEAAELSYGHDPLPDIGIALARYPPPLLLDAPSCGSRPKETKQTR